MKPIPNVLIDELSPSETRAAVQLWWAKLTDEIQNEIIRMCDIRQDFCSFVSDEDESGQFQWHSLPILIKGRFVEEGEAQKNDDWTMDLYEYLINHPEVTLLSQFKIHTFHICTSNEKVREALKAGIIHTNFMCPLDSQGCLMDKILHSELGKSLYLEGEPINIFQRLKGESL